MNYQQRQQTMKATLTLLTALLLAPLAALHAADKPEPVAQRRRAGRDHVPKAMGTTADAPDLAPGAEYSDRTRIWQGSGSSVVTPKGRIWFTWMTGGHFEGDNTAPTYTLLFTSSDGGATLEGPVAVTKSPLGKHVQDGGLWIDPKERLWWYYYAHGGMVANIADDPEAAQPRFQSPFHVSRGFFMNKPTVLADGSWLWTPHDKESGLVFRGVVVYRSQGEGRSLHFLGCVNSQPDAEINIGEPWTVTLSDGRIAMFIRTLSGIRKTISADGGALGQRWNPCRDCMRS